MKHIAYLFSLAAVIACSHPSEDEKNIKVERDSINQSGNISQQRSDTIKPNDKTRKTSIEDVSESYVPRNMLVNFAKSLQGIPYRYASTDPSQGFDCSGFITYVFNHFNIEVPRSSIDFTNIGKDVIMQSAQEGDLILFTGTADSIRTVGHMGIVVENSDTLRFIHSTSGKANGVTISTLTDHYKKRFVKTISVYKKES